MEIDKNLFRLEHIVDSIEKIEKLVAILKSSDNFHSQWIEQDALIRNFEVLGEASNHISEELKSKYPHVVWNEMRGCGIL